MSRTAAAAISSVAILPFVVLEWMNQGGFEQNFPIPLFVMLWLLAFAFALILPPLPRRRMREAAALRGLVARLAGAAAIGWVWISIVIDQMPCFLGVPNCD